MKVTKKIMAARRKWVKILRSGKYKQTRSKLYDGEGAFCVLGVACDIDAKETGSKWRADETEEWHYLKHDGLDLPKRLQKKLGLDAIGRLPNPITIGEGFNEREICNLIGLNDDAEMPLEKIADIIEEQFIKNACPNANKAVK